MLFQGTEDLDDMLVRILAKHPGIAADDIRHRIQNNGMTVTAQGMYRRLKMLADDGVVFRLHHKYYLHSNWVESLTRFAEETSAAYAKVSADLLGPVSEMGRRTFVLYDFAHLNDCWMNILMTLAAKCKQKEYLSWSPHLWFVLTQSPSEIGFWEVLRSRGFQNYKIVGGDSYLDRRAAKYWKQEHISYIFKPRVPEFDPAKYISVLDDYVVSLALDKRATEMVDTLFESTRSEREFSAEAVLQLFSMKIRAKITLEQDARRAARYRSVFARVFDLHKTAS